MVDTLIEGYKVSPCGVITSPRGKPLKPWLDSKGRYAYINLGKNLRVSVHRLVALTYLPNPDNKPCVHHKDANTRNNRANNLEWVTYAENMQYHATDGNVRGFYGDQKLVPCEDTDNLIVEEYQKKGSIKAMEGFMGCTRSTLGRYIKKRGLVKSHKVNQHD